MRSTSMKLAGCPAVFALLLLVRGAGAETVGPVEKMLTARIPAVEWQATPLVDVFAALQKTGRINVAVNWPALEKIGLTRQTPVSFRCPGAQLELILRFLLEGLSTEKGRLNYAVSEIEGGLVEISTMAEFGRHPSADTFDVKKLLALKSEFGPEATADTLEKIVRDELLACGEPEGAAKLKVDAPLGRLVLIGPPRAHHIARRTVAMLNVPTRVTEVPPRAGFSAAGGKVQELLKKKVVASLKKRPLEDVAAYLSDMGKVPIVVLPNTAGEVPAFEYTETPLAEVLEKCLAGRDLAWEIHHVGVIVIGRREILAQHDVLAAYDLRSLLRKIGKNNPAGEAERLRVLVQEKVAGMPRREAVMFHGLLVVRGSAAQQREVAALLTATQRALR